MYFCQTYFELPVLPISSGFELDKMQASKRNAKRSSNTSTPHNIRGGTFRPPIVPQVYSLTPFNTVLIRLRESAKSPWNISIGDVHAVMTKQLGFTGINFTGDGGFEVRFMSIMVWNITDGNSDLTVAVRDPSGTASTELARVDSMGMKNMYARIGFNYPISISSCVYHSVKDGNKQIASIYATRPGYEVHLKIMWRGAYFSVTSTLGFEDFSQHMTRCKQSDSDDIDAEIDAMECKLRILELRKLKVNSASPSVCE